MQDTEYKGQRIWLSNDAKFCVSINGIVKRFASLKSAKNAVDKSAIIDFKPIDVLVIDESGYNPCTYSVKRVKLVKYQEEKGYRRSQVMRYLIDSKGNKYRLGGYWGNKAFIALKDEAEAKRLCDERTKQSRLKSLAEKEDEKIGKKMERLGVDLDPCPD